MIEKREVVRLKIPYPDIRSGLASKVHMYICIKKVHATKRLVKCQSMKLSSIISGATNYIIEAADINRNPFSHTTLIDCDKLFIVDVTIPRTLLTKPRSDISQILYDEVVKKMISGIPSRHKLPRDEMAALNESIQR